MKKIFSVVLSMALMLGLLSSTVAFAADPPSQGHFDFTLNIKGTTKSAYKLSNYPVEKVTTLRKGAIKLSSARPVPSSNFKTCFVLSDRDTQTSTFAWYTYGGTAAAKPQFNTDKKRGYLHYAAMRMGTDEVQSSIDCVGSFTLDWTN